MNYTNNDISVLKEELKKRVVTFEYTKKDGTVRTAQGTMNEEYLPEKIPNTVSFEKDAIDSLMEAKNIPAIDDYAKENGLKFIELKDNLYIFAPIKKERKINENLVLYYDVEKEAFRSFDKNNFLGMK